MPGVNLGQHLPQDWRDALLVGRLDAGAGPVPIVVNGRVRDVSRSTPTVRGTAERVVRRSTAGKDLGALDELPITAALRRSRSDCWRRATCNASRPVASLYCSLGRRKSHRRARARRPRKAQSIRDALGEKVGADIRSVRPGSATAARLKEALIADGLWSQYLEVAIGPDAEVFTKSPVLSAVGWGDWIGVRSDHGGTARSRRSCWLATRAAASSAQHSAMT